MDLAQARDRAQLEPAVPLQNDRRALIRNHSLWRVDDGLEHALQVERGRDFVADGVQGLEDFALELGHQQAGVMQRGGGSLRQATESEEFIVIEWRAIEFVDGFNYADQRSMVNDWSHDQRENRELRRRLIALH